MNYLYDENGIRIYQETGTLTLDEGKHSWTFYQTIIPPQTKKDFYEYCATEIEKLGYNDAAEFMRGRYVSVHKLLLGNTLIIP